MKQVKCKRANVTYFHLFEISQIEKYIEMESQLEASIDWEEGAWESLAIEFPLW